MPYSWKTFEERSEAVVERLNQELASVRTGKASPAILDRVSVEAYGSKQSIAHVATVLAQDARSILITPWDKSLVTDIQRAIDAANLGVSTGAQGESVRVSFPELSGERREALLKVVGTKLEEARIALRTEREKVWSEIQEAERSGELSEDEKFRAKDELQKIVDRVNATLTERAERKRAELAQ